MDNGAIHSVLTTGHGEKILEVAKQNLQFSSVKVHQSEKLGQSHDHQEQQ